MIKNVIFMSLLVSLSVFAADAEPKNNENVESGNNLFDEVLLDDEIKPVLTYAFFNRSHTLLQGNRQIYAKSMSGVNRERFKLYSDSLTQPLSELISRCQKHSASINDMPNITDIQGVAFLCKCLNDAAIASELDPQVMEINDWTSYVSGGYSKKVKLSTQAAEKLKQLKNNMNEAGSLRTKLDRPKND